MNSKTAIEFLRQPNGSITGKNNKIADLIEQMQSDIKIFTDLYAKVVSDNIDLKAERAAHTDLREKLRTIEWIYETEGDESGWDRCPACDNIKEHGGHAKDCWLAAELNKGEVTNDG